MRGASSPRPESEHPPRDLYRRFTACDTIYARFDDGKVLTEGPAIVQYLADQKPDSGADAYLFTVLNWTGPVGIELGKYPVLSAYQARIAQRPKVQQALREEGSLE